MARAAVVAETAGVPSVSVVCESFDGQAIATARGHGFDGLPVALTVGHVDAQSDAEMVANFVSHTVDAVIEGLTGESAASNGTNGATSQGRSAPLRPSA